MSEIENSQDVNTHVTDTVRLSLDQGVFVLYLDDKAFGQCRKYNNMKILMEEIADDLESKLQASNKRVLRENVDENTIHLSRQTLGRILSDGAVSLKHTLQIRQLPRLYKIQSPPTPPQAPLPPPIPPSPRKKNI